MSKEKVAKLLTILVVMCGVIALISAVVPSTEASRMLFNTSIGLFASGMTTLFVILTVRW